MRFVTLRDEHFVNGVHQLQPGGRQFVRVRIASTDNIDTSGTPDNKVILKLPPTRINEEVTVLLETDLDTPLRTVGYNASQGVGHAQLVANWEAQDRGAIMSFIANSDRAWEIMADSANGSFSGSFNSLTIDSAEVYADGVRVDGGATGPTDVIVSGRPVQLTAVFRDGDGNALNGVPHFFGNAGDDPAFVGIALTSDGTLTPQEPSSGDPTNVDVFTPDDAESSRASIKPLSTSGLSAALTALLKALHTSAKMAFLDETVVKHETAFVPGSVGASSAGIDSGTYSLVLRTGVGDTDGNPDYIRIGITVPTQFAGDINKLRVTLASGAEYETAVEEVNAGVGGILGIVAFTDEGNGPVASGVATSLS